MNRSIPPVAIVVVTLLTASMSAAATPHSERNNYRISTTVPLGAPDRWDYVVYDPVDFECMLRTAIE